MTPLQFRLLSYPGDGATIQAAFADLDRSLGGASIYQSHAWFRHTASPPLLQGVHDPRVLLVQADGRVAGVFPLARTTLRRAGLPIRALTVPGRGEAGAVQLAGLDFALVLPRAYRYLAREWPGWDALVWPKQVPLSDARRPAGRGGPPLSVSLPSGHVHTIPVPASPEELTSRLSVKARAGLRNARNRLKGHAVEYTTLRHAGDELRAGMDAFLELEGAGWKQLTRERWPNFQALAAELAAAHRFQLWQLRLDGRLAAALIGLEGPPGRLGIYKIAYAEDLARLSPGRLLVYQVLTELAREGVIHTLDMMSPAAWLAPWNPVAEPLETLWCFRPTPRGLAGFGLHAAWALARPVVSRLRQAGPP